MRRGRVANKDCEEGAAARFFRDFREEMLLNSRIPRGRELLDVVVVMNCWCDEKPRL